VTQQVTDRFCLALGEAFAWPLQGLIRHFRPQLEERVKGYAQKSGAEALAGGWEHDASKKGRLIAPGQ
jgi:NADH dehydrogenase (ubiquinone) flavoprotein 1